MRAARLHAAGDLRVGAEPTPEAGPGMSLVRVTAVGVCGSDLHWWDEGAIGDAMLAHPLVLGHEGAGVIADGPRRGERVAIDPAIPDETCRACRDLACPGWARPRDRIWPRAWRRQDLACWSWARSSSWSPGAWARPTRAG